MVETRSYTAKPRWKVNHLSEILNRDDPTNPVEGDKIEEQEEIEAIHVGGWRIQEVKDALRKTEPGKAARVDEVVPDLQSADMD